MIEAEQSCVYLPAHITESHLQVCNCILEYALSLFRLGYTRMCCGHDQPPNFDGLFSSPPSSAL